MIVAAFACSGCFATAEGARPLRDGDTAATVAPDGWIAHDPFTSATYCPVCWAEILGEPVEEIRAVPA